ncbi:hypothetical protein R50345_12640 [Paenibacillus sp. FSL R5-0345]|nr:hypothetical protein R50345_12640 [Paenibacillus sp. FSL R5-0345]
MAIVIEKYPCETILKLIKGEARGLRPALRPANKPATKFLISVSKTAAREKQSASIPKVSGSIVSPKLKKIAPEKSQ